METKNIPALLAVAFFILSMLLLFGIVKPIGDKPTDNTDSLVNLCVTVPEETSDDKTNGFIIDKQNAKRMADLYKAKEGSYNFKHNGIYISTQLLAQMIVMNGCTTPKGIYVTLGAEEDPTDPTKLITNYILSLDTSKKDDNKAAFGYKILQKPTDGIINAKINNGTSLCPERCFHPLD